MNKYTYICGLVLLQLLNMGTAVEAANFIYTTENKLDLRQDEDVGEEKIELLKPKDQVTVNDVLNLASNDNFSLLSFSNDLTLITGENAFCSVVYQVGDQRQKNNASVRFLPQVEGSQIFKGIFDYDQSSVCQVNKENEIISRIVEVKDIEEQNLDNSLNHFEKISLIDYTAKIIEFTPPKINYKYLEASQNINSLISFKRPVSTYQSNIESLSLINSMAIKPIAILTNNKSLVSNKPVFSQPPNIQSNLNYLNAMANNPTTANNNNPVKSYQNQVPSSPILKRLNQEREKQAQQNRKQQEDLKKRIQQRVEQKRQQQERLEEQRKKERDKELKKRRQQLKERK